MAKKRYGEYERDVEEDVPARSKEKVETPEPSETEPELETPYRWPGPQRWTGLGPAPADLVADRGTKEWRRAVDARRRWVGDQVFRQQVENPGFDFADQGQMSDFLSSLDILDEVGGGRHLRNLFLGNLPEEGFGMSRMGQFDIPAAVDAYRPEWKWRVDRDIQGGHLKRDRETGLLVNPDPGGNVDNPEFFNAFGQRVQSPYIGPVRGITGHRQSSPSTREIAPSPPPITMTGQQPSQFYTNPTPPPAFGSSLNQPQITNKKAVIQGNQRRISPGWYSSWQL